MSFKSVTSLRSDNENDVERSWCMALDLDFDLSRTVEAVPSEAKDASNDRLPLALLVSVSRSLSVRSEMELSDITRRRGDGRGG